MEHRWVNRGDEGGYGPQDGTESIAPPINCLRPQARARVTGRTPAGSAGAAVWARVEEQLQREPRLQAKTLLGLVAKGSADAGLGAQSSHARAYACVSGKPSMVRPRCCFFSQVHEPGRRSASDFTLYHGIFGGDAGGANVWPSALPLRAHALELGTRQFVFFGEFCQPERGYAKRGACGVGRRAAAASHGSDDALAVNHEGNGERYTARYQALLHHYGLEAEATNPASGHENGDCEQGHRRLKECWSRRCCCVAAGTLPGRGAYWQFVQAVVAQRNAARGGQCAGGAGRSCSRCRRAGWRRRSREAARCADESEQHDPGGKWEHLLWCWASG